MKLAYTQLKQVPHTLVLVLCVLFSVLYGVWLLPHTVFIRHSCLIIGSLLSLPIIFFNWRIFIQRRAIPILLILLLLVWVTIHLWFIAAAEGHGDVDKKPLEVIVRTNFPDIRKMIKTLQFQLS